LALAIMGTLPAVAAQRRREGDSRLDVQVKPPANTLDPGEHALGLATGRDGILRIPRRSPDGRRMPLAVLLHGAGGGARRVLSLLGVAESLGIAVLAPDSRDAATWDAVRGNFGPDVEFLERALAFTFDRCAVDPSRIAIGGFSDGASYALSLGLDNGELFSHILAFSPGFIASRAPQGRARVFISHGRGDEVLPIASTSRRIVPALDRAGYSVRYREFDGPHTVPRPIAHEAFSWFAESPRPPRASGGATAPPA
jgi:phospholipase/carboxylesterase